MKNYLLIFILFFVITTNSYSTEISKVDQFILVDGGTFQMGDESSKKHSVTLDSFYISKYELTQKEWSDIMGYNPSVFKGDKNPVDNIIFYEAIEFCNKKSLMDGLEEVYTIDKENKDQKNLHNSDDLKWSIICNWNANGYRLPTEAEWEFAARGGNKTKNYKFSGSDTINNVGWYIENSNKVTKPTGKKKPNELGLYDMSGNVWERCWDWYELFSGLPAINPKGPEGGYSKVYRGGGAGYQKDFHATTVRGELPGIRKNQNMGMRLAKSKVNP
ncbi:MAG: hypothetical protein A2015_10235 [Spirochaetes bacterium GWF1_31_7]|nr:MAG: hypothetical protein A2Y30_05870 [Spirochaetes bacterium GWE1_32_154]OHD49515.1 MAG: hypothetical protein A2Y29_01930 [Spirochaetes bacterium GWE2_31_10]OHD49708.1 MAG: hypothetical protein A2015_10235 [Spirochaetes bacterium GWF1_31_7]OHD83140.1 MAG: hypothetical protein A2355_14185 [Spirochaetes bacterium RIFOXYB1_FULL_32_8]